MGYNTSKYFYRQQNAFSMTFNLDNVREKLAHIDALPLLSVLGVLAGLFSGATILLFRFTVEQTQLQFLTDHAENFESLPAFWHFAMPMVGASLLAGLFYLIPQGLHRTGVALVIERFNHQQGHLSLKGLVVQFLGAAISLISGHSMGREGPAVHLGAASSSLIGQWAGLPNNSMRILVGCGCASAISASFNTPIAGVIFAMEVVMLEYSIITFTPIILASVVGTIMVRAIYGHESVFTTPAVQIGSLYEIPYLILAGILLGCLSSAFIGLSANIHRHTLNWSLGLRFGLAGAFTGICAYVTPEIMGVGYDTVNLALMGKLALSSLLLITLIKLLATSVCTGAGIPAGIIGPTLFMGATAGAALGYVGNTLLPTMDINANLYAMIGMAAVMSAVLQAPLAALMTLLELTANPNIIFPGMLVVVIASMITSEVFKQKSLFHTFLEIQGVSLRISALSRHLQGTAVPAVMERSFIQPKKTISKEEGLHIIAQKTVWLLVQTDRTFSTLITVADLARHLENLEITDSQGSTNNRPINLLKIPANRFNASPVLMSATLKEALDCMDKNHINAVYVQRQSAPGIYRIFGIVTRQDIERFYQ